MDIRCILLKDSQKNPAWNCKPALYLGFLVTHILSKVTIHCSVKALLTFLIVSGFGGFVYLFLSSVHSSE